VRSVLERLVTAPARGPLRRRLAAALAAAAGHSPDDIDIRALPRYIVLVPSVTREANDKAAAINTAFDRLERGWGRLG
jgi:alkanesulfonate monooxygenase SsuD/methylene tetrahydromethanopterin reductase-like flavin-dependent oxidoreductase (luciferase family)